MGLVIVVLVWNFIIVLAFIVIFYIDACGKARSFGHLVGVTSLDELAAIEGGVERVLAVGRRLHTGRSQCMC